MRIEDVYRPNALTCNVTDRLVDVANTMTAEHVGALAVVDGNIIVGIVSERDIVRAVADGADVTEVTPAAFASRHIQTAKLNEDTTEVAQRMLEAGVRHLPVVRDRTVVGMISMRDLLAIESWL